MGNFTLVGARPGVGKTEFAVDYAISKALIEGRRIMYFCPLRKKDLFQEEIEEQSNASNDVLDNLILNDTTGLSIDDIIDICNHGICSAIVLDELNEFCDSRYKPGVEKTFKELQTLTKEKGIDVIVLTDLLASADDRKNYIPEVEDVKYSDIVTKYIDNMILLTRPKLYNEFSSEKGLVERKIALTI